MPKNARVDDTITFLETSMEPNLFNFQNTVAARLRELEDGVASVAHQPCPGLDQSLAQGCQRQRLDCRWRSQRAQEIGEVVGQGVQLEPNSVGRETHARVAAAPAAATLASAQWAIIKLFLRRR